ncbi:MAG: 1-acyl-sn-glycerol-3-phosphate acyltransferase [Tannerellaceae bacterium]|jgi:1-acyl-sn-glycerol-3-phosphate acyltransferase|nr:1-acyl-sn-glycerol-3-phosphate acyltransferase [Tannerellaceae bacterium]
MKKALSSALLKMAGWKLGSTEGVDIPKCIVCVAPHTSNWDFPIGKLFYTSIGRTADFLIKKEWFFFPFNIIFKALGGVPIDRDKRTSVTEQMVEEFAVRQVFHLAITPEGTRKRTSEWKRGFYYIALNAKVPILLAYVDYSKKEVGIKTVFHPTGDPIGDLRVIRSWYKGVKGRNPQNFVDIG